MSTRMALLLRDSGRASRFLRLPEAQGARPARRPSGSPITHVTVPDGLISFRHIIELVFFWPDLYTPGLFLKILQPQRHRLS
jgi:hypothetical protein